MARAAAAANKNDCDDAHFKLESCKIILKQGDLMAEEDVDVIVIPIPDSDQDNRFQTYPLYDALLSKATNKAERDRIKSISSKMRSARTPQFIMISNKSYILTTTPYYQNPKTALTLLRDVYTNCLHVAINEKCQTIAFPTIGCGNSGFQTEEAARMLHDGLVQFSTKETKQFKEIRIVVYKKDVHGAFVSFFVELGGHKTSKIKFIEMYEFLYSKLCFVVPYSLTTRLNTCQIPNLILDHRQNQIRKRWHGRAVDRQMRNDFDKTAMKKSKNRLFTITIPNLLSSIIFSRISVSIITVAIRAI